MGAGASTGTYRLNTLFEMLSHPFRRYILLCVDDDSPCRKRELLAGATEPNGTDPDVLTLQLRHRHLPKLAEAGYIDWDRSSETVRRGRNFEEVEPLLRYLHDHQDEIPAVGP